MEIKLVLNLGEEISHHEKKVIQENGYLMEMVTQGSFTVIKSKTLHKNRLKQTNI